MSPEVWKAVPGYEGRYEVSDAGRIRSVERVITTSHGHHRRLPGKIRIAAPNRGGYMHLRLTRSSTTHRVHRLVLEAFVGPCPPGMVTRHLNGDPKDNRLINLRYGTFSENSYDRARHGTDPMAAKTHCPRGHEYSGDNLIQRKDKTGRICRTCQIQHQRNKRARGAARSPQQGNTHSPSAVLA